METMEQNHESLIGQSPKFLESMEKIALLAQLERPILIIGERGTGKELAAMQAHYLSSRWNKPYLKVNCASLPDSLLASDLFGHESGAFTGANTKRKGRFERAHNGTLFLDEIADASLTLQESLLRIIEYGEYERLGGDQTQRINVKIIAATHADLKQRIQENRFRADLLDRLAFDVIRLPPLRERQQDIILLAEYFAQNLCSELKKTYFPGFTQNAQNILLQYSWSGNIRELKNTVERSVARALLTESSQLPINTIQLDPFEQNQQKIQIEKNPPNISKNHDIPSDEMDGMLSSSQKKTGFKEQVATYEKEILKQALFETSHHQGKSAQLLKLSYHQFRGLLRKHNMIKKS